MPPSPPSADAASRAESTGNAGTQADGDDLALFGGPPVRATRLQYGKQTIEEDDVDDGPQG